MSGSPSRRVALLTLGCARNEVDSEELAARLATDGWQVTTDGSQADVVVVNTCGFVEKAKRDSIDTLLAAADTGAKVVATGCLAQRYGRELADSLPEADAVLGFDHYPDISARLTAVLAGETIESHEPVDRRTLLPITPVDRHPAPARPAPHPGVTPLPRHLVRKRLTSGPVAPLKLASGCDRRCAFCAIPTFRGAFVSRTPDDLLVEATWLAGTGVRELILVSENSTSYGKDLGDPRLLEKLLPQLAAVEGIARIRVSYLQPAETRPGLIEAIVGTPGVAAYFDLSFQHSSADVLRRMRRFGSTDRFLVLLESIRRLAPEAGVRSNVIVGFPGETRADIAELERFLDQARLDAIGVFDYSDEDGTEAAGLSGKVTPATIRRRYERISARAEELCAQRAQERVGSHVDVIVDEGTDTGGSADAGEGREHHAEGRAAHQAPEVDGSVRLTSEVPLRPGDLVRAVVTGSDGVDLTARTVDIISAGRR